MGVDHADSPWAETKGAQHSQAALQGNVEGDVTSSEPLGFLSIPRSSGGRLAR
ncbi:hypothetical protein A176_001007 [Myxococcus hansupus]|uniref:Uncharacterized protein n=1 Tax=Pseudomyxococcus hansupus TaxID=1297742 RepID=A0A0H4WRV6_9BACT|nr:hypothetical protein A176_001007 [Myxococcus hansupus]